MTQPEYFQFYDDANRKMGMKTEKDEVIVPAIYDHVGIFDVILDVASGVQQGQAWRSAFEGDVHGAIEQILANFAQTRPDVLKSLGVTKQEFCYKHYEVNMLEETLYRLPGALKEFHRRGNRLAAQIQQELFMQ